MLVLGVKNWSPEVTGLWVKFQMEPSGGAGATVVMVLGDGVGDGHHGGFRYCEPLIILAQISMFAVVKEGT